MCIRDSLCRGPYLSPDWCVWAVCKRVGLTIKAEPLMLFPESVNPAIPGRLHTYSTSKSTKIKLMKFDASHLFFGGGVSGRSRNLWPIDLILPNISESPIAHPNKLKMHLLNVYFVTLNSDPWRPNLDYGKYICIRFGWKLEISMIQELFNIYKIVGKRLLSDLQNNHFVPDCR